MTGLALVAHDPAFMLALAVMAAEAIGHGFVKQYAPLRMLRRIRPGVRGDVPARDHDGIPLDRLPVNNP